MNNQKQRWPARIWIVRHGESAGNVAREIAEAAGHHIINIGTRDVDVPLSPLGERQAAALGRWFGTLEQPPTTILSSPYLRAQRTAELLSASARLTQLPLVLDERLREKEFGIVDRLTKSGIISKYPEQAEFRRILGKFYHRAPGGESWCDVVLRLRSIVQTLCGEHCGGRVVIVCHTVVVLCFRYLLERMTEEQVLTIDRATEVANCSVTSYNAADEESGGVTLDLFNFVAPITEAGEVVTTKADVPLAPK